MQDCRHVRWLGRALLGPEKAIALLLVLAAQSSAFAAESPDRSCRIEPLPAHCTKAMRRDMHRRFNLPPIEIMARRQPREVARSPVIVAIGTLKTKADIAMIMRRSREGIPMIEVHREPVRGILGRPQPLKATLSDAVWASFLTEAQALDTGYWTDRLCVGGGAFTVEVVDSNGRISSRTNDACGGDPGIVLFSQMADIAVNHLPHCRALLPDHEDVALERLLACFSLKGDLAASTELYNLLGAHEFWNRNGRDPDDLATLIDDDAHFAWPGLPPMATPDAMAEFMTSAAFFPFEFDNIIYQGIAPDRVVISACLTVSHDRDMAAFDVLDGAVLSIWERAPGGPFRMTSFAAAPARPIAMHHGDRTAIDHGLDCRAVRYTP